MADKPDLFDIHLLSVDRTLGRDLGDMAYNVEFDCDRGDANVQVSISLNADEVTTTEIVPVAMSDVHQAFADLAEQTRPWKIEPGQDDAAAP